MKKKNEVEVKKRNRRMDLLIDWLKATLIAILGMSGFASLMVHFTIGW